MIISLVFSIIFWVIKWTGSSGGEVYCVRPLLSNITSKGSHYNEDEDNDYNDHKDNDDIA